MTKVKTKKIKTKNNKLITISSLSLRSISYFKDLTESFDSIKKRLDQNILTLSDLPGWKHNKNGLLRPHFTWRRVEEIYFVNAHRQYIPGEPDSFSFPKLETFYKLMNVPLEEKVVVYNYRSVAVMDYFYDEIDTDTIEIKIDKIKADIYPIVLDQLFFCDFNIKKSQDKYFIRRLTKSEITPQEFSAHWINSCLGPTITDIKRKESEANSLFSRLARLKESIGRLNAIRKAFSERTSQTFLDQLDGISNYQNVESVKLYNGYFKVTTKDIYGVYKNKEFLIGKFEIKISVLDRGGIFWRNLKSIPNISQSVHGWCTGNYQELIVSCLEELDYVELVKTIIRFLGAVDHELPNSNKWFESDNRKVSHAWVQLISGDFREFEIPKKKDEDEEEDESSDEASDARPRRRPAPWAR